MKNITESVLLVLVCSAIVGLFTVVLVEAIDRTMKMTDRKIAQAVGQMDPSIRETVRNQR